MQTISFLLFKLQVSGLGSQDILSEKPWKRKKIYAGIIFTSEEKATYVFCVNHQFQAFWSKKKIKLFGGRCCGKNVNKSEEKKFELHKSLVRRIHK